jgi:PAS domain S-box-containing protein
MGQTGPSNTTLFRYATGKAKRRNLVVERYVLEAVQKITLQLVEDDLERSETQRKQVETKLEQREVRFHQLVENARDVIYRYRFGTTPGCEYVSPRITDLLGHTPEEIYADPDLLLNSVHPVDRERLQKAFQGQGEFHERATLRWVHKNGGLVWIERINVPIYDEQGALVAIEGIARDVTERRYTEQRLRASEARFRSLVETAPSVIIGLAENGQVLEFNPEAERVFGRKREEVVGQNYLVSFLSSEARDLVAAAIKETLAGTPTRGFESSIEGVDGRERSFLWNINSFQDFQGQAKAVILAGQDITALNRFADALLSVVEGLSGASGRDFLQALVRQLALTLQVKYAFLSDVVTPARVAMRVFWTGEDFADNFQYEIKGTPCEKVFQNDHAYFSDHVQANFPEDHWLQENGIESYLAIAIYDPEGKPFGHLGVMHDGPLEDDLPRESILRTFALRASAELSSMHAQAS